MRPVSRSVRLFCFTSGETSSGYARHDDDERWHVSLFASPVRSLFPLFPPFARVVPVHCPRDMVCDAALWKLCGDKPLKSTTCDINRTPVSGLGFGALGLGFGGPRDLSLERLFFFSAAHSPVRFLLGERGEGAHVGEARRGAPHRQPVALVEKLKVPL